MLRKFIVVTDTANMLICPERIHDFTCKGMLCNTHKKRDDFLHKLPIEGVDAAAASAVQLRRKSEKHTFDRKKMCAKTFHSFRAIRDRCDC